MGRWGLAALVRLARDTAPVVVVLVLELAQRVAQLVRGDQRGERVAAGGGGVGAARAAVGVAVGQGHDLPVRARGAGDEVGQRGRRRGVDGEQALHAVGVAAAPEAHVQRGVTARGVERRVAVHPGFGGRDLHRPHIDVRAVRGERLGGPEHIEVLLDVGAEGGQLRGGVAVAEYDDVEALVGGSGGLYGDDGGRVGRLFGRAGGGGRAQEAGGDQGSRGGE
jgi:hypothetical protein